MTTSVESTEIIYGGNHWNITMNSTARDLVKLLQALSRKQLRFVAARSNVSVSGSKVDIINRLADAHVPLRVVISN